MKYKSFYVDLDGRVISLEQLDAEEHKLLARVQSYAAKHPDWDAFDNFFTREIARFYDERKLSRAKMVETPIFRIAQDLSSRIAVAGGHALLGDYRDDLQWLIRERFKSQREFCKATGLSEDMLSHVLAGRKHLAIDTLEAALSRISYRLRIARLPEIETKTNKKAVRRRAIA